MKLSISFFLCSHHSHFYYCKKKKKNFKRGRAIKDCWGKLIVIILIWGVKERSHVSACVFPDIVWFISILWVLDDFIIPACAWQGRFVTFLLIGRGYPNHQGKQRYLQNKALISTHSTEYWREESGKEEVSLILLSDFGGSNLGPKYVENALCLWCLLNILLCGETVFPVLPTYSLKNPSPSNLEKNSLW